jgi:predicted component of type VI protein secretion system
MPVHLLSLTEGPNLALDKPIMLIGRQNECDIQLNSRKVSRRHCVVAQIGDYLVVRDLGSTNGIRVNGEKVIESRLKAGDELTVGNFKYRISVEAEGAERSKPSRPSGRSDSSLEEADKPIPIDEGPIRVRAPAAKPVGANDDSSFELPARLRNA